VIVITLYLLLLLILSLLTMQNLALYKSKKLYKKIFFEINFFLACVELNLALLATPGF